MNKPRYLDVVPTGFGKTLLANSVDIKQGVHVRKSIIDITENYTDAVVFSQIVYWYEPDDQGFSKLRRQDKNSDYWITKNHSEWYEETRCIGRTIRRSLERLRILRLIDYELHGEKGKKTPWIRINWDEYGRCMNIWLQRERENLNNKPLKPHEPSPYAVLFPQPEEYYTPGQSVHTPGQSVQSPLDKVDESNTKTTSEITSESFSSADAEPTTEPQESEEQHSLVREESAGEEDNIPATEVSPEKAEAARVYEMAYAFAIYKDTDPTRYATTYIGKKSKGVVGQFAKAHPDMTPDYFNRFLTWHKKKYPAPDYRMGTVTKLEERLPDFETVEAKPKLTLADIFMSPVARTEEKRYAERD